MRPAWVTVTVAVALPAVTVTVAVRCAPVFALAVIVNELVLLETVSHDWLELTVQLLWLVVTVTEAVLLVLAGLHDELESDTVAVAPACVTAIVAGTPPAVTVTVALRCAPVFALAVIVNELVLLETVSHDWLELTVHVA